VYWLKIVALEDQAAGAGTFNWGWHDRDYRVNDPLASTPPAVAPGERDLGPFAGGSVWHFQDDAVHGNFAMQLTTASPDGFIFQQSGFEPQNYVNGLDGPTGISQFSKDLAFELYTVVPEPACPALIGLTTAWALRRRRV
jgi:hypothetical protein